MQVFTDGSAKFHKSWPHRRAGAAWGAVVLQQCGAGELALIGVLGGLLQVAPSHQHFMAVCTRTISAAEITESVMGIRLVLDCHSTTVGSAAQYSPSLTVLADSEHALRVLERKQRAVANAGLIHGGRAVVDAPRRVGSFHRVHVPSHERFLCNELADRIANAAREGHLTSAVGPFRFPVDDEEKVHACRGASFWVEVASHKGPTFERIDCQGWQA